KLQSARENSAGDAWHRAFSRASTRFRLRLGRAKARPYNGSADENAQQKAGVDQWAQLVETDDEVGGKHHQYGNQKGQAAITHHGAREQRDGADRSEVPRMRRQAQGRGKDDHGEDENGAEQDCLFLGFFLFHLSLLWPDSKPAYRDAPATAAAGSRSQ